MYEHPHYLAGVPSLSPALASRLEDPRPLSVGEELLADMQLNELKQQLREARAQANAQRDEPIEPEPPYGTI